MSDNSNWDNFDWDSLGEDSASANNNHSALDGDERRTVVESDGMLRRGMEETDDDAGVEGAGGRWITQGGVVHWESDEGEREDDLNPREEAQSPWAADDIEIPLAASEAVRVRAVRAWLARRRLLENDALGTLLLERRQLYPPADEDEQPITIRRRAPVEESPLDLALTEHQAAADEYERLLLALDDIRAHGGSGRMLVEFYLLVTERLGELAMQPEAPDDFAEDVLFATIERAPATTPPTEHTRYEWEGRAGAAVYTRRRIERVSAPEPEE